MTAAKYDAGAAAAVMPRWATSYLLQVAATTFGDGSVSDTGASIVTI